MSNSSTPTPNAAAPTSNPEQSTQLPQEQMQELLSLRRERAAISQIMWNLVRTIAPEEHQIEVSPTPSDPLWQLAFVQSSDPASGKICILAGAIPPITEQEKKRVVRMLRGTSLSMEHALTELKLPYPPSYVEKVVEDRIKWSASKDAAVPSIWESVTPPSIGERATNLLEKVKTC